MKKKKTLNKLKRKELLRRIHEVILRITEGPPDCVLEGSFDTYRQYILEPFKYENYSALVIQ